MSLTYAILTALEEAPSTGADLVRRFDKSIGYFWNCTHQQIYRELKQMTAAGLVHCQPADTKPGSNYYRIEPLGEQALLDWILSDSHDMPTRDPSMVKLRAMASFSRIDVDQFIRDKRARHQDKLTTYERLNTKAFATATTREQFIKKMVLDAGIRRERAYLEWCDEFLKLAATLPPETSPSIKKEPTHVHATKN